MASCGCLKKPRHRKVTGETSHEYKKNLPRSKTLRSDWTNVSGGFCKARAQKEAETERTFHPNWEVRIRKDGIGNYSIWVRKKNVTKKRGKR